MMQAPKNSPLLFALIILVQLFDVIIHVMVEQFEPLRVTSNVVMILWAVSGLMDLSVISRSLRPASIAPFGVYLALNLVFLVQNGFRNPELGNAPRTMLFLLVLVTAILSTIAIRRAAKG